MPPRGQDNDTTADFAADCVCEFLEAALHATLHRRGVYPDEAFELVRLYDVPLHRARHPELRDYLATAVAAIRPWVRTGAASRLELVICEDGNSSVEVERHTFVFGLHGAAAEAAAQLRSNSLPKPMSAADVQAVEGALRRQLAEMLVRHSQTDAWLQPPLGGECTFRLVVHTDERGRDPEVLWVQDGVVAGTPRPREARAAPPVSLDIQALPADPMFHLEVFSCRYTDEARRTE